MISVIDVCCFLRVLLFLLIVAIVIAAIRIWIMRGLWARLSLLVVLLSDGLEETDD